MLQRFYERDFILQRHATFSHAGDDVSSKEDNVFQEKGLEGHHITLICIETTIIFYL